MSKTRAEQETIITRANDENEWEVYSCDPVMIRKLDKRYKAYEITGDGKRYHVPKKLISFRSGKKMSEIDKKAVSERLSAARQNRQISAETNTEYRGTPFDPPKTS